jgi:pimeloyl-ACP methyl ester carboxylesterase
MFKQLLPAATLALALAAAPATALEPTSGATAEINGLTMYYEVHGETGEPLVLLHGAYMTIPNNWDALIPTLSETHQVIVLELQGHGRTSDRDTPITYEAMADDVAALLDHLDVEQAALFGYSMGGGVAIRVAMQHPDKVSRLVVASASIAYDAFPDTFHDMIEGFTAEMMLGSPFDEEHIKLGKTEAEFVALFEKLRTLDLDRFSWDEAEFAGIDVPSLLIFGDADIVEIDHIAKMHTLLGGITDGDSNGLPKTQLMVLPGTSHINVVFNPQNIEYLKIVVPAFLAQQLPQAPQMMF